MAKQLRFAPADTPSHVWARGNNRQDIFFSAADHLLYRDLLVRHCLEHRVRILTYCFMSNHIHLILNPATDDGISLVMHRLQAKYAHLKHFSLGRSGHFWQARFKSAAMDESYLWAVFRYVELNPVRARLVESPAEWPWSSAATHLGEAEWPAWLDRRIFESRHCAGSWRAALSVAEDGETQAAIRQSTRRDRPLAHPEQIRAWERDFAMALAPQPMGRPRKKPVASASSSAGASMTA